MLLTRSDHCQTKLILKQFDSDIDSTRQSCDCCYNCIKKHSQIGCLQCFQFLNNFLPPKRNVKISIRVSKELKRALTELFDEMHLDEIKVEESLTLDPNNFIKDILRKVDDIQGPLDVRRIWHIPTDVAYKVFMVINEVVFESSSQHLTSMPSCEHMSEEEYQSDSSSSVSTSDESDKTSNKDSYTSSESLSSLDDSDD